MKSFVSGSGPQSYSSYDRFGNRTSLSNTGTEAGLLPTQSTPAVSASSNRLTGYSYDLAGNVTSDGAGNTFSYDGENRQIMHVRAGVSDTSYSYDGDGRRVKKTDAGGTTVFVYDAMGKLVAEYTTASVQGSGTSYITQDHLGSTRVMTDAAGGVKARHDYLPYGEEISAGIGSRTSGQGYVADNVRQKFTGKERDSESGLDYFLARYYSSAQGRFTSSDEPLAGQDEEDPQTWNLYLYTSNNPINRHDPDGRRWFYREAKGKVVDVQWVSPNDDGTFTSPGEGFNEFVPTTEAPFLRATSPDGTRAYYLGETSKGGPTGFSLWTGKVEDASMDIVGLVIPGRLGIKGLLAGASALWGKHLAKKAAKETAEESIERAAKYGTTPRGRPLTKHYAMETGPKRNIPGSVVDHVIDNTKGVSVKGGKIVHYDPVNNVTVVTGRGQSIVSAHKGPPGKVN